MAAKMKPSVEASPASIPKIMVFRPTLEEMKDFSKYLEFMESQGAHEGGLAKIIPPSEWVPRKSGYDNVNVMIKSPIQQVVSGSQGVYQQYNIQKRSMSFKDFKKLANSPKYCTPEFFDYDDLERKYWKNITYNSPIYGADVPGTLTDPDCKEFNINNLNTILDMINDVKIMGVNTAYLYFGMWKSTFAWHTEDMDLYSINYLHFGAPKSWYTVPPKYGKRIEKIANEYFREYCEICPAFLRHKMTLLSPQILKKYNIPYNKITQESGEIMITFPYAYHAGYNHGLNCAESTNFALQRWIEFGKRATVCRCRSDTVKICMDIFVKTFQPDRYENWLNGQDYGPDPKDPSLITAAPSPYVYEDEYYTKKPKRAKRQLVETKEGMELHCTKPPFDIEEEPIIELVPMYEKKKSKIKKPKTLSTDQSFEDDKDSLEIGIEAEEQSHHSNDINGHNNIEPSNTADDKHGFFDDMYSSSQNNFDKKVLTLEELSRKTLQYTENPTSFDDEREFNLYSSLIPPHCAICTILSSFEFDKEIDIEAAQSYSLPSASAVLIPRSVFLSKIRNIQVLKESQSHSHLLVCSTCKICVHSVCYGVNTLIDRDNWKCDRCAVNEVQAACCLCPLRGGALKITTCNQWVHLTCALVSPSVKIECDLNMQPVDISGVQALLANDRMVCTVCSKKSNSSYISNYILGYCVRCHRGSNCNSFFHITCAYRDGIVFELTSQSTFTFMCKKCSKNKASKKEIRNLIDIEVESTVIAKYNGLYTYAKVIGKHEELFHHVQFVDNTIVDSIKSYDILNKDCVNDTPLIGDPVEVIWNKEQLHGKYTGNHMSTMYTVLFDNDTQIALKREDLYIISEELPKRVQIKFIDSVKLID